MPCRFLLKLPLPAKKKPVEKYEYISDIRRFLQWRKGNAILLGEANILPEDTKKYFGDEGDGIHMMFNFYVNQFLFYALASADVKPLIDALKATKEIFPTCQWAHFIRNHDELDLGRLTEEQRRTVFEKFGPAKNMQLYERGIRRRLAPMLGNRQQIELAYSMLFSLPGTPVMRYGDEIGMGDNLELKERNAVRTPMQWSDDYQAGFSEASELVHPVIEKGPYTYKNVNVEAQRRDRDSLLNWTTTMIRLRKECPEIGWGAWEIIDTGSEHVLGISYYYKNNSLVILHNFDEKPYEITIKLHGKNQQKWTNLLANEENIAREDGSHHIVMEAFAYKWFRVGDLSHILRRVQADKDEEEGKQL